MIMARGSREVAKYQIKLMRRSRYNNHVNLMNLTVDESLFLSVIWRALKILRRANPDFFFEVYSEEELICDGNDGLKVKGGKD
jgi:hypothetical protein